MCRNITTLRGLEPAATSQEVEAAARQYVRKVSGVQSTSPQTEAAFERAVSLVTRGHGRAAGGPAAEKAAAADAPAVAAPGRQGPKNALTVIYV